MRATILTWVAIVTVTGATSLRAQEPRPDFVGSRVRVTLTADDSLAPARIVVGKLVAVGDSALVIRAVEGTLEERFATSRIQRFEVRTGRNRGEGAKIGTLVGLGMGLVLGYAAGDDCSRQAFICFDRDETAAGGALIGATLGMGIGFMAGRGDRWAPRSLPARVSVAPAGRGALRLAASIRFR